MSYQDIRYGVENGVATVTLHRPDNLNAWTRQMERDVRAAMTDTRRARCSSSFARRARPSRLASRRRA